MPGRRTNVGLLVLLAWALATGLLAFAIGTGLTRWVVVVHGVAAFGVALLGPGKWVIARRGVRRRRPGRAASIALGALVLGAMATGVAHATGVLRSVGGLSAMQLHVAAALLSVPLIAWHAVARPARLRRSDLSRRRLLQAGALTAGAAATYGVVSAATWASGLPGRQTRFTGSYPVGRSADAGGQPVTQWLFDAVPSVDPSTWSLAILSRGRTTREVSLEELRTDARPVRALLDCTGGWYCEQTFSGIRLDRLLEGAERSGGRSLVARSVTGYDRRFPLGDAAHLWVATMSGGQPLPEGNGFPARIVAPGRRGFWWVKWLASIRVEDAPWWWQPPFPLQ